MIQILIFQTKLNGIKWRKILWGFCGFRSKSSPFYATISPFYIKQLVWSASVIVDCYTMLSWTHHAKEVQ